MTRIWWILIRALKRLKNLHFDWSLLCKVYNVWPEQVQKSYISWRWRVMQNFKKTDLWFGKWHEEFAKFSSEHLKVSKLVLSWDPLSKAENKWNENLQRGYVWWWQWRMMKNLKRNWLVVSKLTWGIWRILTRALENLKNLHFNGLLLTKVYNVWAKKVQRSYISWH